MKTRSFCQLTLKNKPKTPEGLVFLQKWGSLRHASNVAFLCLHAANRGVVGSEYAVLAQRQIDYILGDNKRGFSYQIGFGSRYPSQPHHRSSSCPASGGCSWADFNRAGPNQQVLKGALVGGLKSAGLFVWPDQFR